jgi:hypothetical protein
MQSQVEYSDKGIFIPFEWFKEMGREVHVQKIGQVIFIESAQRQAVRQQLQETVQHIREAGQKLGILSEDEIASIVDEVREERARYR